MNILQRLLMPLVEAEVKRRITDLENDLHDQIRELKASLEKTQSERWDKLATRIDYDALGESLNYKELAIDYLELAHEVDCAYVADALDVSEIIAQLDYSELAERIEPEKLEIKLTNEQIKDCAASINHGKIAACLNPYEVAEAAKERIEAAAKDWLSNKNIVVV